MAKKVEFDIDELKKIMGKFKFFQHISSIILIVILLIIAGFTCLYTVPTDSEAVIQRFGKYVRTAEPGLHFKLPFNIETKTNVPVERQLKLEFGFESKNNRSTNRYQFTTQKEQIKESSLITGDKNAVLLKWVVQYRIDEPKNYLFNVRSPELTMRDASESIMREMVGDRSVDEVLTSGRQEIQKEFLDRIQFIIKDFKLGIKVEQVQIKSVNPPLQVQSSFNDVNKAQQEKNTLINNAYGQYNRAVPRAKGEAYKRIAKAEGFALKRINEAQGDAERFELLLKEFNKAPLITRQRLYLEKMGEILANVPNKVIIDQETKNFLPLLNLNNKTTVK